MWRSASAGARMSLAGTNSALCTCHARLEGAFKSAFSIEIRSPRARRAPATCAVRQRALADPPLPEPTATRWRTPVSPSVMRVHCSITRSRTREPPSPTMIVGSSSFIIRGASPRRTPLHARSRGPFAPRRSRGSLASLVRLLAGASPRRSALTGRISLAGPLRPAPLAWLTRFARSRGSLASLVRLLAGASPRRSPLCTFARGAPLAAPLAWLTRFARSLCAA